MRKYITILLLLLLMPTLVFAKTSYNKGTLEDALKAEKIKYDLGDYTESEDKINIYLFRGNGCPHCQEFLEYVAKTLIKDHGDKFNVVSIEVWNDKDNANLMQQVAKKLGEESSGVPYIIIGEKSFSGYSESMNEDIVKAIEEEYNSEEKHDILDNLDVETIAENKKESKKDNSSIILLIVVAVVGIIVLVVTGLKKKPENE